MKTGILLAFSAALLAVSLAACSKSAPSRASNAPASGADARNSNGQATAAIPSGIKPAAIDNLAQRGAIENVVKLPPDSDADRMIALAPVVRQKVAGLINATAVIEPDAGQVAHITTRIPGRVMKLIAELGQEVKPGQPLAILSSVELGRAKTRYLEARSILNIAEQQLKREESLYAKKLTPFKDLLDARARRDTALAEYRTARETLRLLIPLETVDKINWTEDGLGLSEFPLTSPIAGTLVKRDLTIGQMIESNQEPLTVINLDRIWVLADVYEHDVAGLRHGEEARVRVEAYPGEAFDGRVVYVADQIDRRTRTVQARIVVPNPGHLLKPGMFAHAEIESASLRDQLVVPKSAVYQIDGHSVVFVPDGPHGFAVRRIKLGSEGEKAIGIVSGLTEGERVVTDGGLALKSLVSNDMGR